MHRIAAVLLSFVRGNQLTIKTAVGAEFSRIFSEIVKTEIVNTFLIVLKKV